MKTPITLLSLAIFSLSALAADVTGTWRAEFDTQRGLQNKDGLIRISQNVHAYLKDQNVPHTWHVDDHAHDMQHWKKGLYSFSQLIFKPNTK